MRALHRLWSGELPLGKAFWAYAVTGGIVVNLSTTLGLLALLAVDRPLAALVVGYAFSVPYNIVVVVGVWRSAARHPGDARWAALVRGITLVGMIVLSLT